MLAETVVHTEGVNWELVTTLVTTIVGLLTVIFGLLARYVSARITTAIDKFRIQVMEQMDKRVTILEYIVGVRQNDATDVRFRKPIRDTTTPTD